MNRLILHIFACMLSFFLWPAAGIPQVSDPVQLALMDIMENKTVAVNDPPLLLDQSVMELYAQREMRPLWVKLDGPGSRARIVANALNASFDEGLDPDDYALATISRLWQSRIPTDLAKLDILLTQGLGDYLMDMAYGRAEPCLLDPKLFASSRKNITSGPGEMAMLAFQSQDLNLFLTEQAPGHEAYRLLRTALARYRTIADQGGWPHIPAGPSIKPGMAGSRIPAIRRLLSVQGDYRGRESVAQDHDADLIDAVRRFQARHNLEIDGVIGKQTLAAMNVSVTDRIEQILVNMELWRWLPHRMDGKQIYVNIAGFYLQVRMGEKVVFATPVIGGKVSHETPVFSEMVRYIEFNPFWNIPLSIARDEIIPEMVKNPAYLRKHNIRILEGWPESNREIDPATINWRAFRDKINRYRLRQDPGPDNALGRIKFALPNPYDVYLHDTPAHELFKRTDRAFSHGCIRVSRALELAFFLLGEDDPSWTRERIERIVAGGKRTIILLQKPVPIHILYRTAIVNPENGAVSFFKDVYGRDALLRRALLPKGSKHLCRYPPLSP